MSKIPAHKMLRTRMHIKKYLRKTVSFLMHYSGLSSLWYLAYANRSVRILVYHGVELEPSNSYSVSLHNFELQMQYLKNHFNIISLTQYNDFLAGKIKLPKKSVIITFDDGFRSFYELAYPVLARYQLMGTCFLIASKLQTKNRNFMDLEQLKEIAQNTNVTLASHGISHKSIAQLGDSELKDEILGSKLLVEKYLDIDVDFFSYPYGTPRDFDERSTCILSTARYKLACTAINGINSTRTHPLKLRRTKIEFGDDFETFKQILRGALDIWIAVDYFLGFLQNKREVVF